MPDIEITVAIATLNRPANLVRCLDGLLAGAKLPGEIIVVDQSQDDATQSLVKESQYKDAPIIYVKQNRRGLSASRNAGICHSSRSIIVFTDDDCVPGVGWVNAIESAFASSPILGAVAGSVLPLGNETSGTFSVSLRANKARIDFKSKTIPWLIGTGGNLAVKREWLERVGCYDERLGAGSPGHAAEDADLIYKLLDAGAQIRYEPDAIVYHERQSKERRFASRWSYGYGIGAFCGIWFRKGDRYITRILGSWLFGLACEFGGSLVRRQWIEVYQRVLSLRGTMSGLRYGLTASSMGGRNNG